MEVARTLCASGLLGFDVVLGASEDERSTLFAQMAAGKARLLRMLLMEAGPGTQTPEPADPQFPDVRIEEASSWRPILFGMGLQ